MNHSCVRMPRLLLWSIAKHPACARSTATPVTREDNYCAFVSISKTLRVCREGDQEPISVSTPTLSLCSLFGLIMAWLQSHCPSVEFETIGQQSFLVALGESIPSATEQNECRSTEMVSHARVGDHLRIFIRKGLITTHTATEEPLNVHYAFTPFGKREWIGKSFDAELQASAEDPDMLETSIPVNEQFVGIMFVLNAGGTWIKDDGCDFFAPFRSRSESFAVDDGILQAHVDGCTLTLRWLAAPSEEDRVRLVHHGFAYDREGEWRQPSSDVFFSKDGIAVIKAPARAIGISFVLQMTSGRWVRKYDDGNFYVSLREREECEGENYHEFPMHMRSGLKRVLSLRRQKPFWVYPSIRQTPEDLGDETIFFVAELEDDNFVAAVAMVDTKRQTRTSFRGMSNGSGLVIRVESDLGRHPDSGARLAAVAIASTLYCSVKLASQIASEMSDKSAAASQHRLSSELLQGIGWCSWDSLGVGVTGNAAVEAVQSIVNRGCAIRWVIIDDGWQDTEDRRMRSYGAAKRFGSMEDTIQRMKMNWGVNSVLAWHTILGYWEGLSSHFEHQPLETEEYAGRPSAGTFRTTGADEVRAHWKKSYRFPTRPEEFFKQYYTVLKELGFDGVKVDAQALVEFIGGKVEGRVKSFGNFHSAMESAAEELFDGTVINCMALTNDAIYSSGSGSAALVWRTSDDHSFPDVEEDDRQVAVHIWSNASSGLWLGDLVVPDWDMFRSHGRHSSVHAAGRAVSGGPIYISDAAGDPHGVEMLSTLIGADGSPLVCIGSARPCERCVFDDPTISGKPYLVWNENPINSIIVAFNLTVNAPTSVRASVAPMDSGIVSVKCRNGGTDFGVYSFNGGFVGIMEHAENNIPLELGNPLDFEIFIIAPVSTLEDGTRVCIFGDTSKMNGGAVVQGLSSEEKTLEADLISRGTVTIWASRQPSAAFLASKPVTLQIVSEELYTVSLSCSPCRLRLSYA